MLLFLIHVAVVVILWILFVVCSCKGRYSAKTVFNVAGVFASIILIGHCLAIGFEQGRLEPLKVEQAKRDAIVWEMENNKTIEGLVNFNEQLTYAKWANDNIWLSWYINDYVDEIELIPLN